MIAQHRAARLAYSTDTVSRDVRAFLAAPAVRMPVWAEAAPAVGTPLALAQLYPALFAPARPSVRAHATRALAFRLGVIGSMVATFAAIHH